MISTVFDTVDIGMYSLNCVSLNAGGLPGWWIAEVLGCSEEGVGYSISVGNKPTS